MDKMKSTTNKISTNINAQIFAPSFIKHYKSEDIFINSLSKAKMLLNSAKFFHVHCLLREASTSQTKVQMTI